MPVDEIRARRGRLYDAEAVDRCLALMQDGFIFEEPASDCAAPADTFTEENA